MKGIQMMKDCRDAGVLLIGTRMVQVSRCDTLHVHAFSQVTSNCILLS